MQRSTDNVPPAPPHILCLRRRPPHPASRRKIFDEEGYVVLEPSQVLKDGGKDLNQLRDRIGSHRPFMSTSLRVKIDVCSFPWVPGPLKRGVPLRLHHAIWRSIDLMRLVGDTRRRRRGGVLILNLNLAARFRSLFFLSFFFPLWAYPVLNFSLRARYTGRERSRRTPPVCGLQ